MAVPACGARNKGVDKICHSCSAAQPDDVQFEQVAQETLIQDEQLIAQAKAGPDVHCPFCGTRNSSKADQCSQCLADLSEAKAREAGQVVGAHQKNAAPDVACSFCGTMNSAAARALRALRRGAAQAAPDRRARSCGQTPGKTGHRHVQNGPFCAVWPFGIGGGGLYCGDGSQQPH